jgi:hypothetical protein
MKLNTCVAVGVVGAGAALNLDAGSTNMMQLREGSGSAILDKTCFISTIAKMPFRPATGSPVPDWKKTNDTWTGPLPE